MAKATYVNEGETIVYTAAQAVAYRDVVTVGTAHIGVALADIPAQGTGVVKLNGVWEFPAKEADAIVAGADVFWNPTAGVITAAVGTGGIAAGIAMTAKEASTVGTVEVKIG